MTPNAFLYVMIYVLCFAAVRALTINETGLALIAISGASVLWLIDWLDLGAD